MRLREVREKANKTQSEVAAYLGVSRQGYNNYELGNRQLNPDMLNKLADYFDVSTDYLLEREEKPKKKTKDEREIESIIENTISDLESSDGLMFDGVPATEEEIEQIKAAMRVGLAMAKEKAREKFTPHKHSKKKMDSQEENNAE